MNNWVPHPDNNVTIALIRLNDALCTWERNTGRESVLILRELEWAHRSISGKPVNTEGITDEQMLSVVKKSV